MDYNGNIDIFKGDDGVKGVIIVPDLPEDYVIGEYVVFVNAEYLIKWLDGLKDCG